MDQLLQLVAGLPWKWIAAAGGGVLLAWWWLRPMWLPTDPLIEEIDALEDEVRELERPGGARSHDDGDRLARLRAVLERRRRRARKG